MKQFLPAIGALSLALLSFTVIVQKFTLADGAAVTFEFPEEKVTGSIGGLQTDISFDPENLQASAISGFVDVASLDTGIKPRNKHLQADGYFDSKQYAQISFQSKTISSQGDSFRMTGDLTLKGITKEVDWDFTFEENLFIATTSIYTLDFGVFGKKNRDKTKVNITVSAPVKENLPLPQPGSNIQFSE